MSIIDDILGIGTGIGNAIDDVTDAFNGINAFFEFLTSPNTWTRVFEVLFGALLIFGALRYGHH